MHAIGRFVGAQRDLEGNLIISLTVPDETIEDIQKIPQEEDVVIDVKKYRKHRSLEANNYFWQLIDKMAKVLHTDKDSVYLLQLSKYGVFTDLIAPRESIPILSEHFRYIEEFNDGYEQGDMVRIRCYYGSSKYNSKEMSDLINGTVEEAKELGIETLTPKEIESMIEALKSHEGRKI